VVAVGVRDDDAGERPAVERAGDRLEVVGRADAGVDEQRLAAAHEVGVVAARAGVGTGIPRRQEEPVHRITVGLQTTGYGYAARRVGGATVASIEAEARGRTSSRSRGPARFAMGIAVRVRARPQFDVPYP